MKEEELLELLQKKRGFFEAILELTHVERTLSAERLAGHLREKQLLLSCIDAIDSELDRFAMSFYSVSQDVTDELDEIKRIALQVLSAQESPSKEKRVRLYTHIEDIIA